MSPDPNWSSASTTATDCTFHQISPYIGRMKTSMARFLVNEFSEQGDLVVDPFCGSGVVALEAAKEGRQVLAGDWNPYAVTLTKAKLLSPADEDSAEKDLQRTWEYSRELVPKLDLRSVPAWVRAFFHRETLRNALAFRDACVSHDNTFLLSCLLGILHHQRPGFLSYPSSHLVPYLKNRKFPKAVFPHLYSERDVFSRLQAKIHRTFRRPPPPFLFPRRIVHTDARQFPPVDNIAAVITSPPYMNELDYVRDNRLRIWFIEKALPVGLELSARNRESAYTDLLHTVCTRLTPYIRHGGYFILVVGEAGRGKGKAANTASLTQHLFQTTPALQVFTLHEVYYDQIPDIRRSRREYKGTKTETVLIYRKES